MSGLTKEGLLNVSPETARKLFRSGEFFRKMTSDVCQGHLQTNLLGLHKSLADDFTKFCEANWGPLPLVFQSDVGQFTAPAITQTDSDIRTDLTSYCVIENGEETRIVENLLEFGEVLKDFVFFYEGCTLSFHKALLDAGISHRSLASVNAYTTNIDCHTVGPFRCKLVVSVRGIPRDLLETTFKVTHDFPSCHGAPVHIGNPALIGIDMSNPTYEVEGSIPIEDGNVPVFWACGTTHVEAMKSAKPALAVSHVDGLYIADEPSHIRRIQGGSSAGIKVITLTEEPYWASVTSEAIVQKIKQLEGFITEDLDKWQNGNLVAFDGLLKSTLALSHASSVALVTILPSNMGDGRGVFRGAIAIAIMLQALGKKVDLVVEKGLYEPLTALFGELVQKKFLSRPISVVQFPLEGEQANLETAQRFLLRAGDGSPRYDHLLAIDGAKKDACHTHNVIMEAVNDLHQLFVAAGKLSTVTTTGLICYDYCVMKNSVAITEGEIKNGCTDSTSDFNIITRMSNWGGYTVAVALYLVSTCPIHNRYKRKAVGFPPSEEDCKRFWSALPNADREERMLCILNSRMFFSKAETDVLDGLSLQDVHAKKIQQLVCVLETEGL